jgi:hypothetical protein
MTLVITPVLVFDVLTIFHWREDKILAFITLPLLAAALWAFWAAAFTPRPGPGADIDHPPGATEGDPGHAGVRRRRRRW